MWSTGINRNIVECKVAYCQVGEIEKWVLIETLWNVKMEATPEVGPDGFVLIETLWNVKILPFCFNMSCYLVLIETLWNVKMFAETV